MMQHFFKQRLSRHQTKLLRYLKYVLNDHIMLFSTFALGGFAFYYSTLVKNLDASFLYIKPLVLLVWFASLFTGHLATLMQEADKVFLLPKENQMLTYLRASFKHSLFLPLILEFLVIGITMPLLIAVNRSTIIDFAFFVLMLWFLKSAHLLHLFQDLFLANTQKNSRTFYLWIGFSFIALISSLYLFAWLGSLIALLAFFYQLFSLKSTTQLHNLDWEKMIAVEQQRMKRIYQFINLFTDVPGISGKVKRRKWLDRLLTTIPFRQNKTYTYLYSRSFIRGSEYSGLFVRLTIIGALILLFLTDFTLVLIVSLLVIYLIGFQLIPIYGQFDYMVLTQLYPLNKQQKSQAVSLLIAKLLTFVASLFSLVALIILPTIQQSLLVIGALALEVGLLTFFYLPSRIKKIDRH